MNKNNSYVFDTGPLYLYFADDKRVSNLFRDVNKGVADGFTRELNLAALYYKTCEKLGRDTALIRYSSLRQSALIVTSPDDRLTRTAAELICSQKGQLSLADAYIISLTKRVRGNLYTTDPRIARLRIVSTQLVELK